MAEMMDNLDPAQWASVEPDTLSGLNTYTVIRRQKVNPKTYKYAVKMISDENDDTMPDIVSLEGGNGKRDPMASVANCELILKDGQVMAINIDGDCVALKSFI